jgi:hypothetical protein
VLDIVEGSVSAKTEIETASRAEAGNVEARTPNNTERKKRKENNNVEGTDQLTEPYQGVTRDESPQGGRGCSG